MSTKKPISKPFSILHPGEIMSRNPTSQGLADRKNHPDVPINEALVLKNGDDRHRVDQDDKQFNGIGLHHVKPCQQNQGRQ